MKVDTNEVNPAFQSIILNPGQKVFLDANFFIPPDRSDVSELSNAEEALRNTYISKIAVHSLYNPTRDNAKDRGEVKSLSFMAVQQFLFFAANDALPVRLIKETAQLGTGLDDMQVVQMYELIYYLYKTDRYDKNALRILYKHQYYLTAWDKKSNPEWGSFIEQMDLLCNEMF
jgi:hypothetical protein